MAGGFHPVTTDQSGRYLAVRRDGYPAQDAGQNVNNQLYTFNAVKVYQVPNLLEEGAQIYFQTPPEDATWSAQNLIENFQNRVTYNDAGYPLIDAAQNRATFNSCYVTNKANLASTDNKFILGVDNLETKFQHAILLVQKLGTYDWDEPSYNDYG